MESLEHQIVLMTGASNCLGATCAKWFGQRTDGLINNASFQQFHEGSSTTLKL